MPFNTHPQAYYTEIARKYKLEGIFYLDFWPVAPSSVVLNDPALLEQVTVSKPLRTHPLGKNVMGPVVGDTVIIVVNGPLWKRLHNAMAPAFSWNHIRGLTGMMIDEIALFQKTLEKRAEDGKAFSMEKESAKLIFDIIARSVFNFRLHAQTTGSQDLDNLHEMIRLAEGQLNNPAVVYNPVKRIKVWWQRRRVLQSLNPSMIAKIKERLRLLRTQGTVPSRKDPASLLDLILREHVQADQGDVKKEKADYEIPKKELNLILAK